MIHCLPSFDLMSNHFLSHITNKEYNKTRFVFIHSIFKVALAKISFLEQLETVIYNRASLRRYFSKVRIGDCDTLTRLCCFSFRLVPDFAVALAASKYITHFKTG